MKILFSEEQLQQGISRMATEINQRFGHEPLTVICVMTGSIILVADLIRQLVMPVKLGSVHACSYRGGTSRSELELDASMLPNLEGSNVLIVDDIFDTGHTLNEVRKHIQTLQPAAVYTAVLLQKNGRQEIELNVDFVGFEIPDEFVVGYGLDYQDLYRNLPYVAILEEHEIN